MSTLQENQSLNLEYERNKKEREMKEEIERLNKENTILRQNSQYLVKQKDELEEELERLNKENELLKSNPNFVYSMRNNKAIEYIEEKVGNEIHDMMYVIDVSDLLDILKGADKE